MYLDVMTDTIRMRDPAFKKSMAAKKARVRTVVKLLGRPAVVVGAVMPVCCLFTERTDRKKIFAQAHYVIFVTCQLLLAYVAQAFMQVSEMYSIEGVP